MARYHEPIVYLIVIALVGGLIYVAEKTKGIPRDPVELPAGTILIAQQNATVPFSQSLKSAMPKTKANKGSVGFDVGQVLVEQVSKRLSERRNDWPVFEKQVRSQVANLAYTDLMALAAKAVDQDVNFGERQVSVYLLSLAGMPAHNALFEILKTPLVIAKSVHPKFKVQKQQQDDALKTRAMIALDQLAVFNPQQLHKTMKLVGASKSSTRIKNLAKISLVSISKGSPGTLSSRMNQIVATAEAQ